MAPEKERLSHGRRGASVTGQGVAFGMHFLCGISTFLLNQQGAHVQGKERKAWAQVWCRYF